MRNGCTDGEVARRFAETADLFDQAIGDFLDGKAIGPDIDQIRKNLLYIRSQDGKQPPRMPQDERKAPPEGSGSSETGGAQ